ncbi:MAG: hypothetical protein K2Y37_14245 [Pirellulales bacterium]|nr:hypothetical protein [Pirellulales bacterium]
MIDSTTHQPLKVSTDGTAGPYIMVPVAQLDELKRLLEVHGVAYWVDEDAISLDDGPYIAVVNLSNEPSPAEVQGILDAAT